MTADFSKGVLWARPEAVAKGIVKAIETGRHTVYLPAFWAPIMWLIRAIPEGVFSRLRL